MYSKTTRNVKITVIPSFLIEQSDPSEAHYVWAYTIQLENIGEETVQLLNRYWHITDATGAVQEVKWVNTAFATASAIPADSANVVWVGAASSQFTVRAAWHKSALQLVGAQLIRPFNGEVAFATDPESGLSIRYWRGSDFQTATHGHRWDMIYGASNVDGLLGARFSGTA